MADNTELNEGTGGDTIRDIDRTTAKTQVVALDIGGDTGEGGEILVTAADPLPVNLTEVAGTALGTPTDFGTTPGAVVAESVNASLFVGTVAAVAAASGILKTGISGAAGATLDAVITAASAPANGLATLAVNETTAPSLTTGQSVAVQASWDGSVFVKPYRRSNTKPVAGTIASATAATLLAAQATGVFADLACLVLTVDPTTAVGGLSVNISDGTITYKFWFDIGTVPSSTVQNNIPSVHLTFDPPLAATTAATAWTIALSVADATVYYVANFVLQKAS